MSFGLWVESSCSSSLVEKKKEAHIWVGTSAPEELLEQRPPLLPRELLTPWCEAAFWMQLT